MSQNVKVVCRFRPPNAMEEGHRYSFEVANNSTVWLENAEDERDKKRSSTSRAVFNFDYVFKPDASQVRCQHYCAFVTKIVLHCLLLFTCRSKCLNKRLRTSLPK